jgi:hypothetical protein
MWGIRQCSLLSVVIVILVSSLNAAATTPPPGFVLQETISVPAASAAGVVSATTLVSGISYMIRASGTVNGAASGLCIMADAEFGNLGSDPSCVPDTGSPVDIGLGINSPAPSLSKSPNWGPFDPTHVYTINFVGLGAPIALNFHDCNGCYGDNSGSMTVEIFAPAAAPATTTIPTLSEGGTIGMAALLAALGMWVMRRRIASGRMRRRDD